MGKIKIYTVLAGMVVLLLAITAVGVEAGKPRYKYSGEKSSFDTPIVIDNSTTSFSYYAELAPGGTDIYQVYAAGGEPVQISMAAPKSSDLEGFAPSIALVGPGIAANVVSTTLPVALPQDMEAVVLNYTGETTNRPTTSDPASLTEVWQGQQYRATYPTAGAYYVMVWDPRGKSGRYIMTVGTQDDFGLFDLIRFPYTWAKLNIWLGNWLSLVVAVLVIAVIVSGATWFLARRRTSRINTK